MNKEILKTIDKALRNEIYAAMKDYVDKKMHIQANAANIAKEYICELSDLEDALLVVNELLNKEKCS